MGLRVCAYIAIIGTVGGSGQLAAQAAAPAASARSIIVAAIARQQALRTALRDYEYLVSVRFAVRNLGQPPDSMSSVALIAESRSDAYWQAPAHYRETLIARRSVNHLGPVWSAVWSTVSIVDVGNFQSDRVEIPPYTFVSPLADDALLFYDFRLLDTLNVAGRRILRLATEPRSPTSPGFIGLIEVADSTYDVTAIDVGVNGAARFGAWKAIRYQERFAPAGDGQWLPIEARLSGTARLAIRVPWTPRRLAFEQEARFTDFRFDTDRHPDDLNEVRKVADRSADHADSSAWTTPDSMPNSGADGRIWQRADSVAQRPPGIVGRARRVAALSQLATASPDFFHFNRVDGAYLGAGWTWPQAPDLTLTTKLGYATGSGRWQYDAGANVRLSEARRLWVGVAYHDQTVTRPSLITHSTDRTIDALLYRDDPLDYYREAGVTLSIAFRPLDFTRLDVHYDDDLQSALPVVTAFSLLRSNAPERPNGFMVPGRMRTLSGTFTYDSRSLLRRDGRDSRLPSPTWTRVTVSAEVAEPALIPDDFDFGRYSVQFERQQRTLRLGITTINALVGVGTGTVPPQRYFTIDFGVRALGFQGGGFRTLGDTSFAGNRLAMLAVRHDFGRLLFEKSGLPLVRGLPFTFSIYSAAFAIDFVNHTPYPGDSLFKTTSSPYTEAGFILGDLLPFLAPINLGAQFTWQLSSQPTRRFQFGLNVRGP